MNPYKLVAVISSWISRVNYLIVIDVEVFGNDWCKHFIYLVGLAVTFEKCEEHLLEIKWINETSLILNHFV